MTRPRYGEGAQIVCDNLVRIYKVADLEVVALQGLDLLVEQGEMVAIVGASGSAASRRCSTSSAGLDAPTAGPAPGRRPRPRARWAARERTRYRRRRRRLRLAADGAQPAALPHRARERRAADDPRRRGRAPADAGRASCSSWSASATGATTGRSGCPAASSSGSRSRSRWPTSRRCCSPTSRPASSTARPSAEVFGAAAHGQPRAGHDGRHRDPRPARVRAGRPHGRASATAGPAARRCRRTELGDDGEHEVIAEEFAVLDRAGRLQLPRAYVEALELERPGAACELEADHIGVWPDADRRASRRSR